MEVVTAPPWRGRPPARGHAGKPSPPPNLFYHLPGFGECRRFSSLRPSHGSREAGRRVSSGEIRRDETVGSRNNVVAALLAILLGGLGIHKFYNGSWGWGIVYILLCWTFLPALAGLIEGIIYLVSPAAYDAKYNQQPPSPWKW